MGILFRSESHITLANGGNLVFTEPAGAAPNDGLVAWIVASTITYSTPTNWNRDLLITGTGLSAGLTAYVFTILRGASAPTLTFTASGTNFRYGVMLAFSGVKTSGSFVDATAQAQPATPDPPAATATGSDDMAIALVNCGDGWAAGGATAPTNYTLRWQDGQNNFGAVATRLLSASGSENPGAFGNNAGGNASMAATVLLLAEPAAAGGQPTERRAQQTPHHGQGGSLVGRGGGRIFGRHDSGLWVPGHLREAA